MTDKVDGEAGDDDDLSVDVSDGEQGPPTQEHGVKQEPSAEDDDKTNNNDSVDAGQSEVQSVEGGLVNGEAHRIPSISQPKLVVDTLDDNDDEDRADSSKDVDVESVDDVKEIKPEVSMHCPTPSPTHIPTSPARLVSSPSHMALASQARFTLGGYKPHMLDDLTSRSLAPATFLTTLAAAGMPHHESIFAMHGADIRQRHPFHNPLQM